MSNKHDANVRKSTLVNFQIGLIASLLFTYVIFEVYTAVPQLNKKSPVLEIENDPFTFNPNFKVYKEPVLKEKKVVPRKKVVEPEKFEIVKDDKVLAELTEEFTNAKTEISTFDPNALETVPDREEPVSVPFIAIEEVPLFPGCEVLEGREEKSKCFSDNITKFIQRKFNTDLGSQYGLEGTLRIYALFEIGIEGEIQNVQVRAPHPKLAEEAKRVIHLLPKMIPGMQRDQPVVVKYQVPIIFRVER